jgi:murein L,D-transpeptidase YafK
MPFLIPDLTGTQPRFAERLYAVNLRQPVDSICVIKQDRVMLVFGNDSLIKVYRIALGDTPVGHKHFQGDERTPEGLYRIDGRNPNSSCHKNLGISYPNARDRDYARQAGRATGGDIKIHGLPNGQGYIGKAHVASDWTNGCVAVTDAEIDELYRYVLTGSPILILP